MASELVSLCSVIVAIALLPQCLFPCPCIVPNNSHGTGILLGASLPRPRIPWPYSIEPLQGPAVRNSLIVVLTKPNQSAYRLKKIGQTKQKWSGSSLPALLLLPHPHGPVWNVPKFLSFFPSNAIKHGIVIAWNYRRNFWWKFCWTKNTQTSGHVVWNIFCLFLAFATW